jgi:hypothetical protein
MAQKQSTVLRACLRVGKTENYRVYSSQIQNPGQYLIHLPVRLKVTAQNIIPTFTLKALNAQNKTLRKKSSTLRENVNIQKFPHKGIPTLKQWWGLCGQMILRAILVAT